MHCIQFYKSAFCFDFLVTISKLTTSTDDWMNKITWAYISSEAWTSQGGDHQAGLLLMEFFLLEELQLKIQLKLLIIMEEAKKDFHWLKRNGSVLIFNLSLKWHSETQRWVQSFVRAREGGKVPMKQQTKTFTLSNTIYSLI